MNNVRVCLNVLSAGMQCHDFNLTSSEPKKFVRLKRANFQRACILLSLFHRQKELKRVKLSLSLELSQQNGEGERKADEIKNYLSSSDWKSTKESFSRDLPRTTRMKVFVLKNFSLSLVLGTTMLKAFDEAIACVKINVKYFINHSLVRCSLSYCWSDA